MNKLFEQALDEKRMLRTQFVRERGFSSRIFPDYMDKDEFVALAGRAQVEGGDIVIHHAEYGTPSEMLFLNDIYSAWDCLFSLSHEDIIVEFKKGNFFIWLPTGEHMYVVFGEKKIIEGLRGGDYGSFSEYVKNSGLTDKGQEFLTNCFKQYTI